MRVASARAAWIGMCRLRRHGRKLSRRYGRRMMRYLRLSCPGCDTATAYALEDNETAVECPTCGQRNTNLTTATVPLTGRCQQCGFPIDSHEFYNDMIVKCPKTGVKP